MAIRVMFINAINPQAEIESRYPPLGLGYLASSLRRHFGAEAFQVKVVQDDIENQLRAFRPDIVGITSVTQNYRRAKEYARRVKAKGIPVLMGGIHISMLPSSLTSDMDAGVVGEGEKTVVDLFTVFIRKGAFRGEELAKINGLVYRDGEGRLQRTPDREPIVPLDQIPLPARDLFTIQRHSYLFSSRGCPFRCVFCASSRFWNQVRFFSAEYVLTEIRELCDRYRVRLISFYDDLMLADADRLEKLIVLLKEEKIFGKIKFSLNARANLLTEDVVARLKAMNVVSVGMGLESGNERVLRYLKGRSSSLEANREAVRLLRKYRIAANASFVIGSPDETMEEVEDTYRFMKEGGLNFVDTYVLTPFPGTPVWEEAVRKGKIHEEMDWERLNVNYGANSNPVLLSGTMTREEMDRIFARFQRLRLRVALKNSLRHPFFRDMCLGALRQAREKCRVFLSGNMDREGTL